MQSSAAGYRLLQEEDAKYAFRKGLSKHEKPEPLFTVKAAEETLKHFLPLHFHERFEPVKGMEVTFTPAEHFLGSPCVHVHHRGNDRTVALSGDVGRQNDVIMRPPELIQKADVLVCESTYGDRLHAKSGPEPELADIITRTANYQNRKARRHCTSPLLRSGPQAARRCYCTSFIKSWRWAGCPRCRCT